MSIIDPRQVIGLQVANRHTGEGVLDRVLKGEAIVTPEQKDVDFLEWIASKELRERTDDIKRVRIEERHKRVDGLVEEWRHIPIFLQDSRTCHVDQVMFLHGDQMVKDWQIAILSDEQDIPLTIICHASRWEFVRDQLRDRGHYVINGDAEFTSFEANWPKPEEPIEVCLQ